MSELRSENGRNGVLVKGPILLVLAAGAGLWLWLFAGVMLGDQNFAYRDAAHFYYPLYQLIQGEWGSGRIPLWNPYDNGGQPLLANPTAGVFYPLKLLFVLPVPYRLSYAAYILWHLLQALLATAWVARLWGTSRLAAALAGISYAFCGNVLFQYCNVIFLVGAAWLPLAWWCGERMLRCRSFGGAFGLGACLALMVLGGDPQMAYIAGLSVAGYGLILWGQDRFEHPRTPQSQPNSSRPLPAEKKRNMRAAAAINVPSTTLADLSGTGANAERSRLAGLVRHPLSYLLIAAFSGGLLCAVQVLPTEEFNRRSTRANVPVPRNLYELAGYAASDRHSSSTAPGASQFHSPWYVGLLGKPPQADEHHLIMYDFSVGPWRMLEYLFPNVSGRQFPTHRRWLELFPGEGPIWVPSLYMGLIPCMLALMALRWRPFRADNVLSATSGTQPASSTSTLLQSNAVHDSPALIRWLSWLVLLFVVMSWGGYAPGWILRCLFTPEFTSPGKHQTAHLASEGLPIGDEFGGLYWLMTIMVPGFVQFRFPGKMLLPAALGLSWLAAIQFDRVINNQTARQQFQSWMRRLMSASLVGTGGVLLLLFVWSALTRRVRPDNYWGQFDVWGSYCDLLIAFVQTALLATCCYWLRWPITKSIDKSTSENAIPVWPSLTLVLLTLVDLGCANGWMVVTAPAELWDKSARCADLIQAAEQDHGLQAESDATKSAPEAVTIPQPYRVFRISDWYPPVWQKTASSRRLDESVRWEHDTLFSKYYASQRIEMINGSNTLDLIESSSFLNTAFLPGDDRTVHYVQPRRGLDLWNVKYFVLPIHESFDSPNESTLGLTRGWKEPRWTRDQPQGHPAGPPLADAAPEPEKYLADLPDIRVLYNPFYLPRAWIVHDVMGIAPLGAYSEPEAMTVLQALLFPSNNYFDPRQTAVLEVSELAGRRLGNQSAAAAKVAGEEVHFTRYEPQEISLEGELKSPGAVILGDVFYPGWNVEVAIDDGPFKPATVSRANLGMRGVMLPAGRFKISYHYQPRWFYVGAVISATAWLALIGGAIIAWFRRRNRARD